MRKIILSLIATISISNLSFGQITLEHSYPTNSFTFNIFRTENGLNYYSLQGNVLTVYNSSHVLTNTLTIPINSDYQIQAIYFASDKLFNNDSLIEFLVKSFSSTNNNYNLTLINQNGVVLQQFGNQGGSPILKGVSGQYKLITVPNSYNTTPTFDVYSLPGTLLELDSFNKTADSFFGFPNPTENMIYITNNLETRERGTLEVYDSNGKMIVQKNVVGNNTEIKLDTTELSSGIYIYKLNGQTNRFIKK